MKLFFELQVIISRWKSSFNKILAITELERVDLRLEKVSLHEPKQLLILFLPVLYHRLVLLIIRCLYLDYVF
jgi:hypothetical protein